MKRMSRVKKYGYVWVTLVFFLVSVAAHWTLAWYAYVSDQHAHQQAVSVGGYLIEVSRDTFENWQSEFLQLIWQVAGLSWLLCVGSPQSKDGDERVEEKLDLLIRTLDPKHGEEEIARLTRKYPKQ